MFKVKRLIAL